VAGGGTVTTGFVGTSEPGADLLGGFGNTLGTGGFAVSGWFVGVENDFECLKGLVLLL